MRIRDLISICPEIKLFNINPDEKINYLWSDSRSIKKGDLFIVKKGFRNDGIKYVSNALKKGAIGIVSDRYINNVPLILCKDIYKFELLVLKNIYSNRTETLNYIGITGTKGKTTTAFLIYKHLIKNNFNACYIGTLGIYDKLLKRKRNYYTTPIIYELYKIINDMVLNNHKFCIMEVSSHALDQKRINGLRFDIAGFTNLAPEHLDYHLTMKNYFKAKKQLFIEYLNHTAIINLDDKYGNELFTSINKQLIGFSIQKGEVYKKIGDKISVIDNFYIKSFNEDKTDFRNELIKYKIYFKDNKIVEQYLESDFNIYNSIMSYLILKEMNKIYSLDLFKSDDKIKFGIGGIPGRIQHVETGENFDVIVDYAHTPESLRKVLTYLNKRKKNRIITIFGCTGDRDHIKRPIMGAIAEDLSDFVIITSDDPHNEDPLKICKEIDNGIKIKDKRVIEPDRKKAIEIGLNLAKRDDIILIAGKGHEEFQIFKDYEIPFNDAQVVKEILSEKSIQLSI